MLLAHPDGLADALLREPVVGLGYANEDLAGQVVRDGNHELRRGVGLD